MFKMKRIMKLINWNKNIIKVKFCKKINIVRYLKMKKLIKLMNWNNNMKLKLMNWNKNKKNKLEISMKNLIKKEKP